MATVVEGKLEEGQSAPQPVKAADKKAKKTQPSQQHSTIECQIFLLDGNVLKLPVNVSPASFCCSTISVPIYTGSGVAKGEIGSLFSLITTAFY